LPFESATTFEEERAKMPYRRRRDEYQRLVDEAIAHQRPEPRL
jgi:hypothetical protein